MDLLQKPIFLRNIDILDGTAQTITDKLKQIFIFLGAKWFVFHQMVPVLCLGESME